MIHPTARERIGAAVTDFTSCCGADVVIRLTACRLAIMAAGTAGRDAGVVHAGAAEAACAAMTGFTGRCGANVVIRLTLGSVAIVACGTA